MDNEKKKFVKTEKNIPTLVEKGPKHYSYKAGSNSFNSADEETVVRAKRESDKDASDKGELGKKWSDTFSK